MARSTDGNSGLMAVYPRLMIFYTGMAFVWAFAAGLNSARLYVQGPTAILVVVLVADLVIAGWFAKAAINAHLTRRRARVARAVSTDQAQDEVREVPETTVFRTTVHNDAVTEVEGDRIGPRTVIETQGRSIRIIRGPLAEVSLELMHGIDYLPMAGPYDRPDRLLFAARVKSVQTLVIELHAVVDEYFYGGAISATDAKDVNDAVQSLLRAMGVPTEALKRPRDRFVGLRKPNQVHN